MSGFFLYTYALALLPMSDVNILMAKMARVFGIHTSLVSLHFSLKSNHFTQIFHY